MTCVPLSPQPPAAAPRVRWRFLKTGFLYISRDKRRLGWAGLAGLAGVNVSTGVAAPSSVSRGRGGTGGKVQTCKQMQTPPGEMMMLLPGIMTNHAGIPARVLQVWSWGGAGESVASVQCHRCQVRGRTSHLDTEESSCGVSTLYTRAVKLSTGYTTGCTITEKAPTIGPSPG